MARPRRPTALQTFGGRVRAVRLHQGMSQEALGFEAGVHPTYVSGVERGLRNISLRNIVAIAAALDVNPAELVTDLKPDRR
jgi:transcriptional regulator with XRE-family HTH domain